MMSSRGKILVLALVLMLVSAPVMADDHLNETDDSTDEPEDDSDTEDDSDDSDVEDSNDNETENETEDDDAEMENETEDDSEIDGTDNSTELTVSKADAEETARNELSDNDWTLEDSSTHEEDGYYRFEFVIEGEDAEAEVRVDGSSGEVFRYEEELERESDDEEAEVEELERVEVQNMEEARERINELRAMVMDLRRQVAEMEADSGSEAEVEVERRNGRTEVEVEGESGDSEVDVEAEQRGPSDNAREAVNGTPGNERAQERRPGFVSRMLSSFFG